MLQLVANVAWQLLQVKFIGFSKKDKKKARFACRAFLNQQKGCFAVIVFLKRFLASLSFGGNAFLLQVVASVANNLQQVGST